MIFEALQHLLIPAAKEVRALGYVREAVAIEARYRRCHTAWAGHLENSQHHILTAATALERGSTLMIIGSGALHDIPVEALLALGHSLILVDIIHLPRIRKHYKNHPRVRLIEQDVTGLVRPIFNRDIISSSDAQDAPPKLEKADLVVSLNILSQLPLNLIKYADKHTIPLPDSFTDDVMAGHLGMLTSLAARSMIISDIARHYREGHEVIDQETALPESICRRLSKPKATWDWHIAPKGELDKAISLDHKVACW